MLVRYCSTKSGTSSYTRVREITVDADTTYVFHVHAWESVSWNVHGFQPDKARAYWNTAITLADWLAQAGPCELDGEMWEAIFPTSAVLGVRNVSPARLLAATDPDHHSDIKRITRGWAREDRYRRVAA